MIEPHLPRVPVTRVRTIYGDYRYVATADLIGRMVPYSDGTPSMHSPVYLPLHTMDGRLKRHTRRGMLASERGGATSLHRANIEIGAV